MMHSNSLFKGSLSNRIFAASLDINNTDKYQYFSKINTFKTNYHHQILTTGQILSNNDSIC